MMLQVLRTHRDTLLSVLETLVHDPLVEWVPKNAKSGAEEQENAMARDAMATIEGQYHHTITPLVSKQISVAAPYLHSDTTHALGVVHYVHHVLMHETGCRSLLAWRTVIACASLCSGARHVGQLPTAKCAICRRPPGRPPHCTLLFLHLSARPGTINIRQLTHGQALFDCEV